MTLDDDHRSLVIALLLSLLLWQLPAAGGILYPLKLFATWLHEFCHGIVMLISGAGFDYLEIYPDTSGIAFAQYSVGAGARAAIASAGYIGTALVGSLMLIAATSDRGARLIFVVFALLFAVSLWFWTRNPFGQHFSKISLAVCVIFAAIDLFHLRRALANFLAAQSCINAVLDIRVLFRSELVINGKVVGASDAHNMAEASFGNHTMWAGIWLAVSLIAFYLSMRFILPTEAGGKEADGKEAEESLES